MSGSTCARCGTELAPDALVCPACAALRHGARLKELAADAESARHAGDIEVAREHWSNALALLPVHSEQHTAVQQRLAALANDGTTTKPAAPTSFEHPWWRRGAAGVVTLGIILVSKLKFLILGLTKASTFASMFAFFGVYWSLYGWPLALGLVISIYIHEMGHVAMLRRLGIASGAPLFIPGVGAVVMLKQHVTDAIVDAKIGLAGPVWGLGAALAALAVYGVTRIPVWLAIAEITAFINLFNLIPVWQLDGARGFHALAPVQRWIVIAVVVLMLLVTGQRMLVLIGAVAVWRAFQRESGPGDTRALGTFVVLIVSLSVLARAVR